MSALQGALLEVARQAGGPLLALDSAGPSSSLCAVEPTRGRVGERTLEAAALPSESLVKGLVDLLGEVDVLPAQLASIVVGLGPGSFTGLRVGLATVKGLAYGAGLRVVGTSSLALLAAGASAGLVAVVLDARRDELYSGLYRVGARGAVVVRADAVGTLSGLLNELRACREPITLVGDYAQRTRDALGEGTVHEASPRAAFGLLHEASRLARREADDLFTLTPHYLKVSEAERV